MDSDKLLHSFGDDDNSPYKHERDFSIEDILNKSDLKHQGHSFGFDDDLDLEEAIEKKYFPDESIEHMGEADSAFLDNVINNKIQGKMQEMKAAKGHTFSEYGSCLCS